MAYRAGSRGPLRRERLDRDPLGALRRAGNVVPARPQGADQLFRCSKAHADLIRVAPAEMFNLTLKSSKQRLADKDTTGMAL